MIFGTYWFAAFCGIFFPIYWLLGFSRRGRQVWLLLACFTFHYHFAGPAGVLPIICLSLLTFAAALSGRSTLIVAAIVVDVGALAFYKYFHFLALQVLGLAAPAMGAYFERQGSVLLPGAPPLAVSFFVFELVHYLYDVKRGHAPMRNLANYASFVFFFPSLVAGPIKRYENFLPELDLGLGRVTARQVTTGLVRIARGYFLKVAIADFLTGFIAFHEPIDAQTRLLQYTLFFSLGLRIWFDFSGYSEIAIGLGLLMGIKLPENFNWPYAATNVRDFWHRWHISLSSWVRDYIYIPMGGSRVGLARTIFNGIVAFALCGLWHGPAWHFVFWGLYHGCGLALSSHYPRMFGTAGRALHRFLAANPLVGWMATLFFVMAGWTFFFYPAREAEHLLKHLFPLKAAIPVAAGLVVTAVVLRKILEQLRANVPFRLTLPIIPEISLRPFALGLVVAFVGCCWGGTYPQTHNIYRDFHRFHLAINPQSAYYPTASQVKSLAEATLPRDKTIVVLGGNSVFLGFRQNVSEVWTIELQRLLGDRYAVFNLGLPNGTPAGEGAVLFQMLTRTYPKLIYAFSEIPIGDEEIDGSTPYHYFFWDAYYKNLLPLDPERRREVAALRRRELKTVDGEELHLGAFLDSFTNADDLWTWVTYRWAATIWSDKTASSPFRARWRYADETKNPEFPASRLYWTPKGPKPANAQFRDLVDFSNDQPISKAVWQQQMRTEVANLPVPLRGQTIACLDWFCPWTAEALSPDEIKAQNFCYAAAMDTYAKAGYATMQFGKDFDGWEYADGTHLDPLGGRHLARELAPVIVSVARAHHD